MDAAISKPPATLPTPQAEVVRAGVSLLPPLSRRGHGPGLILLAPNTDEQLKIVDGVPSAFMKWAEEGFVVVQLDAMMLDGDDLLDAAIKALLSHEKCSSKEKVGVVGMFSYPNPLSHIYHHSSIFCRSMEQGST